MPKAMCNESCTNNQRPRQRSAATAGGRVRRLAQAGQHNEADSEPRTSWRGSAASQSAGLFGSFWSQKEHPKGKIDITR